MINIAICDDEKYILDKIKKLVFDFFHRKNVEITVSQFGSGEELLRHNKNIDILFLDIQMDGIDGMETARKMRSQNYKGSIVKELVQNGDIDTALQYMSDMENLTADMSFPVSTNNPVLDILIGNKLGIAKSNQIEVQCSFISPYPCGIADIDFCIIFSNALDNAISACNRVPHDNQKYIHITGKVQGDFLLIEIINSHSGRGSIRSGTGLANIKAVAEKYHGAMEVRIDGDIFVLSVLLIIPQQSESISQQIC